MIFIDLDIGKYREGVREAEQENFKDLSNLIKTDRQIQANREFFAGAPGREAAISLESDRQQMTAGALQSQLPAISRADVNAILGQTAQRSLRGLYQQQEARFELPVIPELAQARVDTKVATAQNRVLQAESLTPLQQQIQGARMEQSLATLPQQFDVQDTTRARQLAQGDYQLNRANLLRAQQSLAQLNIQDGVGLTAAEATARSAGATQQLRNAGAIGPGDIITSTPSGWAVTRSNGTSIPLDDVGSQITQALTTTPRTFAANVPGANAANVPGVKPAKQPTYNYKTVFDDEGNSRLDVSIKSEGPLTPEQVAQIQQTQVPVTSTAPEATAPEVSEAGASVIGDTGFQSSEEKQKLLREAYLQGQQASKAASPVKEVSDAVRQQLLNDEGLKQRALDALSTNFAYTRANADMQALLLKNKMLELAGVK